MARDTKGDVGLSRCSRRSARSSSPWMAWEGWRIDCPDCLTPEEANRLGFLNAPRTAIASAYYHDLVSPSGAEQLPAASAYFELSA
jgi:hypothetical protein